jgi:hypothetical protein
MNLLVKISEAMVGRAGTKVNRNAALLCPLHNPPNFEGSTASGQGLNQFASGAKAKYGHIAPRIVWIISKCGQYLTSGRFHSTKRMYPEYS